MAKTNRSSAARWWAGTTRACSRTRPTRWSSPTSSAGIRTRGSSKRSRASRRTNSTTRHAQGDFWFDYVADIGDGWNSTYAIADAIAQPELDVQRDGASKPQAGRVLVFGGDEVYPYPTRAEYDVRTETPYTHGVCGPRAPGRVRDPRQSRLVRQPGRVLAHASAGPSAASPAAPRARRAATSRSNCPPTGGCWPSTCSSARISTSRRCSTSRRSPRAWTMPRA